MAGDTNTPNRGLLLQATGNNVGTWGQLLDDQVISIIDLNLGGRLTKSVAGVLDVTLTTTETQNPWIVLTGLIGANINVIFPSQGAVFWVTNATTGAFTVTAKLATGTGVEIQQNSTVPIFTNPDGPAVSGGIAQLPVSMGGTGGTSQATAQAGLGATATGISLFTATDVAAALATLTAPGLGANNTFTGTNTFNAAVTLGALLSANLGVTVTGAGVVAGAPTGGDKGVGTVNATAYYLNGTALATPAITKSFTSSDTAMSASATTAFAHGLGVLPTIVTILAVCQSADGNYSIGDIVRLNDVPGDVSSYGTQVLVDTTNITLITGATVMIMLNKTTRAQFLIDPTKWKWRVIAYA